jgi:hypothetical protein
MSTMTTEALVTNCPSWCISNHSDYDADAARLGDLVCHDGPQVHTGSLEVCLTLQTTSDGQAFDGTVPSIAIGGEVLTSRQTHDLTATLTRLAGAVDA